MTSWIRVIASALVLGAVAGVATAQVPATARAPACDRRCLEGWVDRYLDALVRHDPGAVPLASGARYTENGQRLGVGDGLWRSAKAKGKYRLVVADTEAQQVALIGTLEELNADPTLGTPALVALRLKLVGNEIAEVEQFIARNIDAAKRVESLGRPHPLFAQPVPEAERMSRADLIATANKYFTGMQQNDGKGDYPFAADCNRIENGMQTTNRPTPAGETRPNPKTARELLGAMELPRAVRVGVAALRHAHPRPPLRCRRSRARLGVLVRVLRSRGRRYAQLHDAERSRGDGRACATVDLVYRRAVQDRERPATADRSDTRARALRHDLGLEQLGRRHVGSRPRRDALILVQPPYSSVRPSASTSSINATAALSSGSFCSCCCGHCAIFSRSCSCRSCSRSSPRRSPMSECAACGCLTGPPSPSST